MSQKAIDAFATAKEINLLLGELHSQLEELAEDTTISTQQRHLVMKQICDLASSRNSVVEGYAKTYLEERVEKCSRMDVPGMSMGEGEAYVAGMVYSVKPTHRVEILNRDDESWGALLVALVNAGYAASIQKRLTVSHFVGKDGEKALEAAAGMLACYSEETWSITKPKPKKVVDSTK